MNTNHQCPATDLQDAPASVADSATPAPATFQQRMELLRRHGIETFESVGRPFDLNGHDAVSLWPDRSQSDHVVLKGPALLLSRCPSVFDPQQPELLTKTRSRTLGTM